MWLYGHRDVRYRVLAARCVSGINGHPKCKNIMQFRLQMLHTSRTTYVLGEIEEYLRNLAD